MILIFNEARAVFYGKYRLIPGTNVVDDKFDLTHPTIKEMLEDGRLEKVDESNTADVKKAIAHSYTKTTLDSVVAASKVKGVKDAAKKQGGKIKEFDKEWSDAVKKQDKQENDGETDDEKDEEGDTEE